MKILALVHAVVDHRIVVSFSLPVLDGWGHRHGRKMHSVAIFGLNLWHASFHLICLGVVGGTVPGLNVAIIPAAPRRVLFGTNIFARVHKLLLILELLGRGELTIIVDGTSGHTHDTVYVNRTMCMILCVIHGVTFSPIHYIAIL